MKSTSSAIEISEDVWIALQVEGHDEEGDETSGIRLRDISAPLAAAGISILFLSTYISDVSAYHIGNLEAKGPKAIGKRMTGRLLRPQPGLPCLNTTRGSLADFFCIHMWSNLCSSSWCVICLCDTH